MQEAYMFVIQDTFIHLCAFVGFVATSKETMFHTHIKNIFLFASWCEKQTGHNRYWEWKVKQWQDKHGQIK